MLTPTAVVAIALLLIAGACSDTSVIGGGNDRDVLVFAAASLTDAFSEIESAFERANPEIDVTLNVAGSSALREQILEGAPADVFAPAAPAHMDEVVGAGLIEGAPLPFASNSMVIALAPDNPGSVRAVDDLADDELLVGLCAAAVPCGALAREALDRAGVEVSVDTNEPDVAALLAKIELAELDAGIVYVTDIERAGKGVTAVPLPAEAQVSAHYSIAPLRAASSDADASAFVAFVLSPPGQAVLADHGFGPP